MFWLLNIDSLDVPRNVIKYADDLTMISNMTSTEPSDMQISIDQVAEWCKEHNMIANANKSYVVNVSNKYAKVWNEQTTSLTLDCQEIPQVSTANFLEVNIDDHLSFEQHIDQIGIRVRSKTFVLRKLKRAGIPQHILCQYYVTCIRSKMMYASPVWYPMITTDSADRLIGLEKLALKIIFPNHDSYEERLAALQVHITLLATYLDQSCADYTRSHKPRPPQ